MISKNSGFYRDSRACFKRIKVTEAPTARVGGSYCEFFRVNIPAYDTWKKLFFSNDVKPCAYSIVFQKRLFEFPREANLKQQCLIKIKCKNIQSIQQARVNHVYCLGLNPGLKKVRFQLASNKTFCPNPQPLSHRQVKQRQITKINKIMLSAPSLPLIGFPHKVYNIRIEMQISISF